MNKKLLIGLVIIIVLISGFLVWQTKGVSIVTDKKEYRSGEVLKVNIKSYLLSNVCFSSCYPYYIESKNKEWQSYDYGECQKPNLAEKCIEILWIKGFEISLDSRLQKGSHRLTVPVCVGCKEGEEFRETKIFYSNEFVIR